MNIFFFILIVASSIQIAGYALTDVILAGLFLFLISLQSSLKIRIDWVLVFCIYMIFQTFRGMYVLEDIRMIYWILFFTVVYFSYQYLIELQIRSKLDIEFVKKIFNYSRVYFLIYGLLPILFVNPDDYQGIYWAGSSAAFIIVIPFLCSHFILFERSGYSLSALRFPSLLLYLAVTVIHYSRIGMYLLFIYFLYLGYKTVAFSVKKLFLVFSFFVISFFVLDITRNIYYIDAPEVGTTEIAQINSLIDDDPSIEEIESDINRFLMNISVYEKLISSPKEFLIGSGWYTSRFTLKPYEQEVFNRYGLDSKHIANNKPMQVTSFASIVSDTGVIGLLFLFYFFIKSAIQILQSGSKEKSLLIGFLFINWLFYLIGNSFTSIIGFLLIFPSGIIVSLSRVKSLHEAKNN